MKAPLEIIRISQQGKDQLSKLRRHTGIEHWNTLCRWAFCASIRDPKPARATLERLEGGVEMTWKVFAGEYGDVYAAIAKMRAAADFGSTRDEDVAICVRAHLHRGLGYLASGTNTRSVFDLTARWILSDLSAPRSTDA